PTTKNSRRYGFCWRNVKNSCIVHPPSRRSLQLRRGSWLRPADLRQSFRAYELQSLLGVVAMDLLHIELAHEVDGFLGDDLTRHHDREARRIRDHEAGGDQLGAGLQATIDLGI